MARYFIAADVCVFDLLDKQWLERGNSFCDFFKVGSNSNQMKQETEGEEGLENAFALGSIFNAGLSFYPNRTTDLWRAQLDWVHTLSRR